MLIKRKDEHKAYAGRVLSSGGTCLRQAPTAKSYIGCLVLPEEGEGLSAALHVTGPDIGKQEYGGLQRTRELQRTRAAERKRCLLAP